MQTKLHATKIFAWLVVAICLTSCRTGARHSSQMERIVVFNGGFALAETGKPFHPWGLNYGNHGRLIEDFWETDWNTVAADFRKMKAMHANVVRVHLQFAKFMDAPDLPNNEAFLEYMRLLKLAEKNGLYLDITGLGSYRPSDVPVWYDSLDEQGRWAAQATFWGAIAAAGRSSPAVFCYDLMNEPFVPGPPRKPGEWRSGKLMGSGHNAYDFVQFIALDAAGRVREELARQWIDRMVMAIRQQDQQTLITVGQLPWSREWHHLSGFDPAKIKNDVDFLSVHIYPDSKQPEEALEGLREFAVGKPLVIEETFPLTCDVTQLENFLRASREYATGWMGHYDGDSLKELDALNREGKISRAQLVYRSWLQLFVKLAPEFAGK